MPRRIAQIYKVLDPAMAMVRSTVNGWGSSPPRRLLTWLQAWFPGVFYLKYHLYKNSFPVYALARYRNQGRRAEEYCACKFFRMSSGLRSVYIQARRSAY